jgi:hypothetical protein
MAGLITTSELDELTNTIRAKAIMTLKSEGVFPGVVDRASVPSGNRSYTEPKISGLTAQALTEGVDMAQAQQLTDSLLTITPTEVGIQVLYTKLMARTRSQAVEPLIREAMVSEIARKRDYDGTLMMDGFSVSLGSGSSTTLTPGYIAAARARIAGNSTEPDSRTPICVVHPYSYNDLVDIFVEGKVTTSGVQNFGIAGLSEEFAKKYSVGSIAGIPIFMTPNITIGTNAAKGGVFVKQALVYVELEGFNVEAEKDSSLRATELNGVLCYAYGERRDLSGVELNVGATAPTA